MGKINVKGLGVVDLGDGVDAPTEEQERAIVAALEAKKAESKPPKSEQATWDITPYEKFGEDAINEGVSRLWKPLQPAARAVARAGRDTAYNLAQAAAVPFIAAKGISNALTLPLDAIDYAAGTNMGRSVRHAIPEVKAGMAPQLLGELGAFATGAGALGALGKAAKIPEAVGPLAAAAQRATAGAVTGAAVTDPEHPTILPSFVGAGEGDPALYQRAGHFIDQGLLGGTVEGVMGVVPPVVRGVRDAWQGATGNVTRPTAQGLQAAAGGPERAAAAATEIETRLPARGEAYNPDFPGYTPTTAELTDNVGVKGVQGQLEGAASRAAYENQAPGTVLAERNAANQAAMRGAVDDVAPASLDETAPVTEAARREAAGLESGRNAASAQTQTELAGAEGAAERRLGMYKDAAERDAAAARTEYEDMLDEVLPRDPLKTTTQQGDTSEALSKIVNDEMERLRELKNAKYRALKTGEPVNPERIAKTLVEIEAEASKLGGGADVIANNPTVRRLKEALAPALAVKEVDRLAREAAERALGGKGAPEAVNAIAKSPQTREWAAAQLGVNLDAPVTLTTTDLVDALPRLTAEINALKAQAPNGVAGAEVGLLQRLKRSMAIRNEQDVRDLLGDVSPETLDKAKDAIETYATFAGRFKEGIGRDILRGKAIGSPMPPTSVADTYMPVGADKGAREKIGQLLATVRGAPDEATRAAGETAIKDWLMARLGARLVRGKPVTRGDISKFQSDYAEVLTRLPAGVKEDLELLARNAAKGNAKIKAADQAVENARGLKPEEVEPRLVDLRAKLDQLAKPSAEEAAMAKLGDRLGADPVAVFRSGIEAARPLGEEGLGPLLRLAKSPEEVQALRKMAGAYMQGKMGDSLGGAAPLFKNPETRAVLTRIFTPSEFRRLEAVNSYAAGRQAIESAPSTGTFPTLKAADGNAFKALMDFAGNPGRMAKVGALLGKLGGGDTKAVAERVLTDALTNPEVALKLLRMNLADEGPFLNFLKGYAGQRMPAATSIVDTPIRDAKREESGR